MYIFTNQDVRFKWVNEARTLIAPQLETLILPVKLIGIRLIGQNVRPGKDVSTIINDWPNIPLKQLVIVT